MLLIACIGGVGFLLALPSLLGECTFKRLVLAFLTVVFGILIPALVFLFSAFLTPEWKGDCPNGWLDCFHLGKLALTPVVLWAIISFYVAEICRPTPPLARDLVMGLFLGSLTAGACFLYGAATLREVTPPIVICLGVPLYTAVWYGIRLLQAHQQARPTGWRYLAYLLGSLPFWIAGGFWSRQIFAALPTTPPECFVVTAASRGHARLVGPFTQTIHRGQPRHANQQLIALWNFERLWQTRAPQSHRWFRSLYNRIGPAVARRINAPWKADLVYLTLKPVEWLARSVGQRGATGNRSLKPQLRTGL